MAAGPPLGRVDDMGGPAVRTARDLARAYRTATGGHRPIVPLWLAGKAFAGFRAGGHLAPGHAVGRTTFEDFLAGRAGRTRDPDAS